MITSFITHHLLGLSCESLYICAVENVSFPHPFSTMAFCTKRHILRGWNDEQATVEGTNPEHVKLLQKDLQTKFNQIIENLKADAEDAKLQQEESLSMGLVRLPNAIRQMTVKEFNEAHQCDLLSLLKSKDGVVLSKNFPYNTGKKREYNMTVEATPAHRIRTQSEAPMSVLRTVRKGEGLFSANGSPVEAHEVGAVVATVTKRRRGNEPGAANFEINVGEGRVINLNDPMDVRELDSDMKATAASQLKVLQDQMASLMAQLTK